MLAQRPDRIDRNSPRPPPPFGGGASLLRECKSPAGAVKDIMKLRRDVTIGQQEITFEHGHIARQAGGSAVLRCGETMVLATVCTAGEIAKTSFANFSISG